MTTESVRRVALVALVVVSLTFNKQIGKHEIYAQGAYAFQLENGHIVKPLMRQASSVLDARLVNTEVAVVTTAIRQRAR